MSQKETRDEILDLARGYLQRLGFNGFSFQTIADALGIRKASIHYYFKSKEEMGLALLEEYITAFAGWVERRPPKSSAVDDLEAYFKIFEKFSQDERKLCPIGVLSSDFHTLPKKMRHLLGELHDIQHKFLVRTISRGQKTGEFSRDLGEREAADTILAAVQGGLQASRIRGDAEPLKHLKKFVFKSLRAKK